MATAGTDMNIQKFHNTLREPTSAGQRKFVKGKMNIFQKQASMRLFLSFENWCLLGHTNSWYYSVSHINILGTQNSRILFRGEYATYEVAPESECGDICPVGFEICGGDWRNSVCDASPIMTEEGNSYCELI